MARFEGRCNCKQKVADSITKYTKVDPALQQELLKIVESLSLPGKGILAIDESPSSFDPIFRQIGIENTDAARRDYREMLLSADKSELCQFISGVILNHETLYQKLSNGRELLDLLKEINLIVGIKADKGTVCLFGTMNEETTEGLDNLQERCIQYKKDGCHFAKWRCTYKLSDNRPSALAVNENAHVLARFATIAQSARLVPVIQPEIVTTGEHEMAKALQVHEEVLSVLFRAMVEHRVFLEGMILKPAMVLAGIQNAKFCKPQIVADFTLAALRRTVPSALPTIMFLSGVQSDEDAILNLNAIVRAEGKIPWTLSFSYGRALHNAAGIAWEGKPEKIANAQSIFLDRAKRCSEASQGKLDIEEFKKCMSIPDNSDGD
ncbi:fructose-bisphosphate aldolase-like [Venturia canescens]|uniref:fructose-bisphosphate aldolase-like n=1 Tax=Venturia canescens TaxID=32260 RepID=UPI001C9C1BF4|nr:fructose-bisphosphate aldolase-like [Venturia canescens]